MNRIGVFALAAGLALAGIGAALADTVRETPRVPPATAQPVQRPQTETVLPDVAPRVPTITAITPVQAMPGRTVVIAGSNFAGPRARGFNKVWFGDTATVAVVRSTTRLEAVVPRLPAGSAMVRVETQHGFSKQVYFTVERDPTEFWK